MIRTSMGPRAARLAFIGWLCATACDDGASTPDGGSDAGTDAGAKDAGTDDSGSMPSEAGPGPLDTGVDACVPSCTSGYTLRHQTDMPTEHFHGMTLQGCRNDECHDLEVDLSSSSASPPHEFVSRPVEAEPATGAVKLTLTPTGYGTQVVLQWIADDPDRLNAGDTYTFVFDPDTTDPSPLAFLETVEHYDDVGTSSCTGEPCRSAPTHLAERGRTEVSTCYEPFVCRYLCTYGDIHETEFCKWSIGVRDKDCGDFILRYVPEGDLYHSTYYRRDTGEAVARFESYDELDFCGKSAEEAYLGPFEPAQACLNSTAELVDPCDVPNDSDAGTEDAGAEDAGL